MSKNETPSVFQLAENMVNVNLELMNAVARLAQNKVNVAEADRLALIEKMTANAAVAALHLKDAVLDLDARLSVLTDRFNDYLDDVSEMDRTDDAAGDTTEPTTGT